MSKTDFFQELNYRLRGLPERERQNILSVYEELFQKAAQNGKNEDDIAESLGYPRIPNWDGSKEQHQPQSDSRYDSSRPAQEPQPFSNSYNSPYPDAYPNPYMVKPESGFKAIIASIALGFFNLVFVLGPFVGLCGVIIALYASSAAFLITPVLMVISNSWTNVSADMQLLAFAALAIFGFGILLAVFTVWFSKLFFKLTWLYIRFNMKIIRGA
jgi:uncharacterized membrane protein